jgi:hypothetical protein
MSLQIIDNYVISDSNYFRLRLSKLQTKSTRILYERRTDDACAVKVIGTDIVKVVEVGRRLREKMDRLKVSYHEP